MSIANGVANWDDDRIKLITNFITAAENNRLTNVKNLLERMQQRGISVDSSIDEEGNATALMVASFEGHENIVRYLCQNGANPKITMRDGRTSINLAKNENIRNILLEGCPPDQATAVPQGGRHKRKTRNRRKTRNKRTVRLRK